MHDEREDELNELFETIHYVNPDGTECEDVAPMEEDEEDNYEDEDE